MPDSHLAMIGRDQLLNDLHTAAGGSRPVALVQAIYGLGGVGKTRLMVEYALNHADEYDVVWFIRADDTATLLTDYVALGVALGIVEPDAPDLTASTELVRLGLQHQQRPWLLLFDDAPGPGVLDGLLPQSSRGRVLVTSRNPNWDERAACIPVPPLTVPQSVELLVGRTKQTDEASAQALARALGGLPLALQQTCGYILECSTTLAAYLDLFTRRRRDLWGEEHGPDDYQKTVATTFSLAIENLLQPENLDGPAAVDIINLCAFLAPEPDRIPLDLLTPHAGQLPERLQAILADPIQLNRVVGTLRQHSLIERDDSGLALHRLVQLVAQDRLEPGQRAHWEGIAIELMATALPRNPHDLRQWSSYERLEPHIHAVTTQVVPGHRSAAKAATMFNHLGIYLDLRAQYSPARSLLERALGIFEMAYGREHSQVAITLGILGVVLVHQGDLASAWVHQERALRIGEREYGPAHPEVAGTLGNLAIILRHQGDLAGARVHLERVLLIFEAEYGPNHPDVARSVNNLGRVLHDLGDLSGARAYYERALRIDEAEYGPIHPDVAVRVSNLGTVLQSLGDLAGARAHYERALRIAEAALGSDHPTTVTIRRNLELLDQTDGD